MAEKKKNPFETKEETKSKANPFDSDEVKKKSTSTVEDSTKDLKTPAQPSLESGENKYTVNDTAVTRDDILNNLDNEDFIEKVRVGEFNINIIDDIELQNKVAQKLQPPAEKKLNKVIEDVSDNDDSFFDIMGRRFQSGLAALGSNIYRTPEFIYDVASSGYNQLLDLQNKILPESLEARKLATSEELSDMTGIDNIPAENLEAWKQSKDAIDEKYRKPIFESIKSGNLADAALNTAMSVTESLPYTLSIMIPSAAGVSATRMFGGLTVVSGAGRKEELKDSESSESMKNVNSLLYGMAEATDVLFGSGTAGRAIKEVLAKEGKTKAKKFATDMFDKLIKDNPYLSPFAEGFQEATTTYLQNLTDIATGENPNKNPLEGTADAFIVGTTMGAGSGALIKGTKIAVNAMNNKKITLDDINDLTKNQELYNEVNTQIQSLINTGDLTEQEGYNLINNIKSDVEANASIPDNIDGDSREKAIELQKKYTEVKAAQEQASEVFKPLYKGELSDISTQLQNLALSKEQKEQTESGAKKPQEKSQNATSATAETKKNNQEGQKGVSQEQFDSALEILEPIASERGELTLEQTEQVYEALGENASDVIDLSKKKDAIDLYNELTDKKKEYAKRNEGQPMRKQGEQKQSEGTSDSDMSKDDKAGIQDGKETKKEEVENAKYDAFVKEKYSEVYDDIISSGGSVKDVMFKLDEMARGEGLSKDNILNEDIDKNSELIMLSELDTFVGEDRVGSRKMVSSRENIDKLKEDISKNGFKEPIIIQYTNNGKASIIEGNHRYVAAKELGYEKIPVVFRRVDSLPKNVNSDFVEITPKDKYSKSGKDLGFTSFKIINSDYKQKQKTSKQQDESSGAKKPQQKQSTVKTATAETKKNNQEKENVKTEEGKKAEEIKKVTPEDKLKDAFKKWWDDQKTVGIIYNPKSQAKKDVELTKAIIDYVIEKVNQGAYSVKQLIDDLKTQGVEINEDDANDVYNSAIIKNNNSKQGGGTQPERKIRGFAKSTTEAFSGLKKSIENNPENYYTPQQWEKMKGDMANMTDEEVIELMSEAGLNNVKEGNDNNSVIAAIELINRRLAEGKPIDDIVEKYSKEGTRMGQLIAQFATLKNSTPYGIMQTINKIIEKSGKILTKEQQKGIQDRAKSMLEKTNKLKQFIKEKGGEATSADIKKMKRLAQEAEKASKDFFDYTSSFTPMKWSDILAMTVQGNLLTPMSQATNVFANVSQQALLLPVDITKNVIDLIRGMFGGERVGSVNPMKYAVGLWGSVVGIKETWKTLIGGGSNYAKGEVYRSFNPLRASAQMLSDTKLGDLLGIEKGLIPKTLSPKGKEILIKAKKELANGNLAEYDKLYNEALAEAKISLDDRAKKAYETVLGVAPEIMFRLLAFGDKPFYYFTQYKNLYVDGRRKGLRGEKLRNFVMMPDAKTLESVEKESAESVFMEDGAVSRTAIHITSSIDRALKSVGKDSRIGKIIGATMSFIFKTQVPYVKTPSNIISQTIDLAIPPVAIAKAILDYKNGNKKSGDKNMGLAVTGLMLGAAATTLISNGLISSPFDFGEDKEDEMNVKYDVFPPNHVNISGLERLLNGEDPSIREGDYTIDLRKTGILGAIVLIRSSQNKRLYKEEKSNAVNIKNEISMLDKASAYVGAPIDVMKFSMEQSFLAGTATLLEALKGGKGSTQRWITQTTRAMSSVILPNTLSAITRMTDGVLYDSRVEESQDMLEALLYERLGFIGIRESIVDEYPIRVNMWGEDIKRTPEGKNPLFHHMFDVTKGQSVPDNKLSLEVYNLYRNTLNASVVPNLPKRTFFSGGEKYYIPKTVEGNLLYNEYAKILGTERKRLATEEINKTSYKSASIERKAEKLSKALANATNKNVVKKFKRELIKKLKQE